MSNNLPTAVASQGSDVALMGVTSGDGIVPAKSLVANLSHRVEVFDDINVSLHVDRSADGNTRSAFNYRAYKHRG